MHRGRLDEDTAPAEDPEHEEGAKGVNVDMDRAMKKIPTQMKALMSRWVMSPVMS